MSTLDDLADRVAEYLTHVYLAQDAEIGEAADRVASYFADPLDARAYRRIVEAASDAVIARIRASIAGEKIPVRLAAQELSAALHSSRSAEGQTEHALLPSTESSALSSIERLRDEMMYLVGVLTAFPPELSPDFPAESLRQLRTFVDAVSDELDLVHRIRSQTRDLMQARAATTDQLEHEAQYRLRLTRELDTLELFGADVHPLARRSALRETFVPLRMTTTAATTATRPFDAILDQVARTTSRVLIKGAAGTGKTTLMRWAAITAAEEDARAYFGAVRERTNRSEEIYDSGDEWSTEEWREFEARIGSWRRRIPFVIYLRHTEEGSLPSADDIALHLAAGPGKPEPTWSQDQLDRGRALLLIDGVDEVPTLRRDQLRAELRALLAAFPKNLFIVTSRPEAVPSDWLREDGFLEARIAPMSTHDTARLIRRWHEAMRHELVRRGEGAAEMDQLAASLTEKVRTDAALAPLATTPLLCAMLCALHHRRLGSMPGSVWSLCEALCHMLLERRERESGLTEAHVGLHWAELQYEHKRNLLRRLAYEMVVAEISAIATPAARALVEDELAQIPTQDARAADDVLTGILERSGMVREARPATADTEGVVDFIHNTFKEFLAGDAVAEAGDVRQLIERCNDDDGWRRVALFAVASGSSAFATTFIAGFLQQLESDAADRRRSGQLFCLQCRAVAPRLDARLNRELEVLLTQLFPPRRIEDGEAIAAVGDIAVPYLRPHPNATEEEAAACVRALRLINTRQARSMLAEYQNDRREAVVQEVAYWTNPLSVPAVIEIVSSGKQLPEWLAGQIIDLGPLRDITPLPHLNLRQSGMTSLVSMPPLHETTRLDISGTLVDSAEGLANAPALAELVAQSTALTSLVGIESLTNLRVADFRASPIQSLWPLRSSADLRILDISWTAVTSLSPLRGMESLAELSAEGVAISDLTGLEGAAELTRLNLADSKIGSLDGLCKQAPLVRIDLRRAPLRDIGALSAMTTVREVELSGSAVVDVRPLSALPELTELGVTTASPDQLWHFRDNERLRVNGAPYSVWAEPFLRDAIFVSYAHAQKGVLADLRSMLAPAVRARLVPMVSSDEDIGAGEAWQAEIRRQMSKARVAILLVSKEFLASDFITAVELPYLVQAAQDDGVSLVWIPVNHALFEPTPLAHLQAVIDPARPLDSYRGARREAVLKRIAEAVIRAFTSGPRFRRA